MTLWGADLSVVLLLLAALFFALWGWVASDRQSRAVRQMADWLAHHRAEDWNALPWAARQLLPRNGIATLKRRGLAEDPDFQALEARAKRLHRQAAVLIFAGLACVGLLIAGKTYLGWTF